MVYIASGGVYASSLYISGILQYLQLFMFVLFAYDIYTIDALLNCIGRAVLLLTVCADFGPF